MEGSGGVVDGLGSVYRIQGMQGVAATHRYVQSWWLKVAVLLRTTACDAWQHPVLKRVLAACQMV